MQKDIFDRCRCGYSHTEIINETYVDQITDRVVYQCRHPNDLSIVPYNLQMMMDWDSYINVKYSGSTHFVQYLYKYCYKGPTQRERIEMDSEQERESHDDIKLFIYGQVAYAISAMWRFMDIKTIQNLLQLFVLSNCKLNSQQTI
jgi:hypothetical protein